MLIIYVKNSANNTGVYGYIIIDNSQNDNFRIKKNQKIIKKSIFDNEYYDAYISSISKYIFLKKNVKLANLITDTTILSNAKKEISTRNNEHELKPISDEIGEKIKKSINTMFKKQIDVENEKIEEIKRLKEKAMEKKISKKQEKTYKPIISYSEYIIPIVVFPCETLQKKMKDAEPLKKSSMFMRHVRGCQECLMYNNNERVSLDMINKCDMVYYKMKDCEEIETVLGFYHNLEYYTMKDVEKNHMTLIKLYNKNFEYHNCYIVVGRLGREY